MLTQLQIKLDLNNDLFKNYFEAGYSLEHEMTCIEGINHGSYDLQKLLRQQLEMEMKMITAIDDKPLLEKRIRQVVTLSKDVHGKMSIFESSLDGAMVLIMFAIKQDLQ